MKWNDLSVSTRIYPLINLVAFAVNQHQGSLSSVTSPPANQQPAIHKSHEPWVRSWLASYVYERICQNVGICTRIAPYKLDKNQRVWKSVSLSIFYSLINIFLEFLIYELSTIFTIYHSKYLSKRGNLYTYCAPYKLDNNQRISKSVSLSILYLFINILV